MRIAQVIGRVTLSRSHPSLKHGRYVLAVPMSRDELIERTPAHGEELVVFDELGAGPGALMGLSEGREAANPFHPDKRPVDAYCACLLDQINLR